jgi:predicted nucleic acid-binding protein
MPDAIVDTCCFINLYATGDLRGFLKASESSWHIPSAVLAESLFIRKLGDEQTEKREPIETEAHIDAGLLALVELQAGQETDLYVQLAGDLDDGEAMALAIAKQRGWTLATDDRKAKRFAANLDVPVVTTPELIREWAEKERLSSSAVKALLHNIETQARFLPATDSPDYDWWMAHMG